MTNKQTTSALRYRGNSGHKTRALKEGGGEALLGQLDPAVARVDTGWPHKPGSLTQDMWVARISWKHETLRELLLCISAVSSLINILSDIKSILLSICMMAARKTCTAFRFTIGGAHKCVCRGSYLLSRLPFLKLNLHTIHSRCSAVFIR